ncbi:MAG: ECF transporter S component [Lachnospiraceae bacterium]|nr:ECF transporter S component [Lachnospiraceae bacterium]
MNIDLKVEKHISTKQIAIGGVLLAIMIASQFFKNLSVYITGPIVNVVLVIVTLTLGLVMGIIFSIIAPITAFLITGSPVVAAAPYLMIPSIALGNIIMCVAVYVFYKNIKNKLFIGLPAGLIVGSVLKALFMGAVISNFILPQFCTSLPEKAIAIAQKTFSVTQLITALIASALVMLIWIPAGKYLISESK